MKIKSIIVEYEDGKLETISNLLISKINELKEENFPIILDKLLYGYEIKNALKEQRDQLEGIHKAEKTIITDRLKDEKIISLKQ